MSKLMGFKGKLLSGTAGSTPSDSATLAARDVNYKIDSVTDDVSDRDDIHALYDVAQLDIGLQFELNNNDASAPAQAIRNAVVAGEGVAFRTRDKAAGWGVNADFIVSLSEDQPLKGAQRIKIDAKPTDRYGRKPVWGT